MMRFQLAHFLLELTKRYESSQNKPKIDKNDSLHAIVEDDRQKDYNVVGGNLDSLGTSTNNHLSLSQEWFIKRI
jgi:hypothetical protein